MEDTALCQGIPASQLVRTVTFAAAEERLDRPTGAAIPPGYPALIEDIYRSVYLLTTTLRGQELLRAERKEELVSIVNDGSLAMAEALGKDWSCGLRQTFPGKRRLVPIRSARALMRGQDADIRTGSNSRRAARFRSRCRAARDHPQFPVMLSRLTIAPSMSNSSGGIP